MKRYLKIWIVFCVGYSIITVNYAQNNENKLIKDSFYGSEVVYHNPPSINISFGKILSQSELQEAYELIYTTNYQPVLEALLRYKTAQQPDDWLMYMLVRDMAENICSKAKNYNLYTVYKCFFLNRLGYDATLSIADSILLLHVYCTEYVYNIPTHIKNGKPYVCLNIHDYKGIDVLQKQFARVAVKTDDCTTAFSYQLKKIPDFDPKKYEVKTIEFDYYNNVYRYSIKLNPEVNKIFTNYPVVDYGNYFGIPLSRQTYLSLIPDLKKTVQGMSVKNGVDFLMRLTRYAFLFEPDTRQFGEEKRLLPEQTLLYKQSDCDDRVALFYYLVKEIYNLPMIVINYPNHVTVGISFGEPFGDTIKYGDKIYSICEPTPQRKDLKIGKKLPSLKSEVYKVVHTFNPTDR